MLKRWLIILLQTVVTAVLLALFFRKPEFREQVSAAFEAANPRWILIGIAFAGIENLLGVCRWRIFLRMLGMQLPFWKSVQICLVALFCNTFLLGAAGGDLIRTAYLIRRGNAKTRSLMSIILDRVSGLGGLILYTVILTIWNYDWLMRSPTVALVIKAVIAYQIITAIVIVVTLYIAKSGWTERPPKWAPFPELLQKLGSSYARMATDWPLTLRAMGITLLMLLAYFAVFFSSARAFGVSISFFQMSTLMPAADMIAALPISIGGLGVREQVFALLLGDLIGIASATAVSVSLVGFLMNSSWGLIGAASMPFFKGIVHDAQSAGKLREDA